MDLPRRPLARPDRRLMILQLLGAAALGSAAAAERAVKPQGQAVLERLRGGRLVIFFRHSLTVRAGQPDNDLSSCAEQRNLTPAGRALAEDIGAAFRALAIPVGRVLASPYCRCVDTARLAFGRVDVADWLETNGDLADPAEQRRVATLAAVLQRAVDDRGNLVLVAHGNNLGGLVARHAYTELRIAEAEAIVFAPRLPGPADVVARVAGRDWRGLAT
jgi:phosphohistidine phosphatase SixA